VLKKKIWANFQRIIELFPKKIIKKLLKLWSWDPGVKKAPDPASGSATLIKTTDGGILLYFMMQLFSFKSER
jgi:hypothetical protein